MLPCVCSVIDHGRRQTVVRPSVKHSAIASCGTFLFLPHFDVICDLLLLNRRTAKWNLFANYTSWDFRKWPLFVLNIGIHDRIKGFFLKAIQMCGRFPGKNMVVAMTKRSY